MKYLIISAAALSVFSAQAVSVRGHVTKAGTYVAPHQRTAPNKTSRDNYGSAGNYNPNKGRVTK